MSISKLVKMRIVNFGCFGSDGVEISLDNIVCLVGPNNVGKSTVLRAYEAAVSSCDLKPEDIYAGANGLSASVELWIHIPAGAENIDEKWKEHKGEMLLVRSKWEWPGTGGKPSRATWDPERGEYAQDTKASGLDTVFSSRLPQPFRIGALEDPAKEHAKLLELVLDPVKARLAELLKDETSELNAQMRTLQAAAEKPVEEFREMLAVVQEKVNESYRSVFNSSQVRLSVSLGNLAVDPTSALMKSSAIEISEPHGQTKWSQQGTGSQRALFWSMLEVRSELNRIAQQRKQAEKALKEKEREIEKLKQKLPGAKKEETRQKYQEEIDKAEHELIELKATAGGLEEKAESFLPGYMLLIEEPETALHPRAIRAAKEHLYSLAAESGWQVMLATHHPVFVDPLKDHTTIVRLDRPESHEPPHTYRADEMQFTEDEKKNLQSLLVFDTTVAEMFFGPRVILVEGDTEYAAFSAIMDDDKANFPVGTRPLIVRARGKAVIPTLVRMLSHFKVSFALLHDIDSPKTAGGGRKNGMYTFNSQICSAVADAQKSGLQVTHYCSCPAFEQHHSMAVPIKDKPFEACRIVRVDAEVRTSVSDVLQQLLGNGDNREVGCYEATLKKWIQINGVTDAAFTFD